METHHFCINSPIGILKISGTNEAITAIDFLDKIDPETSSEVPAVLTECARQLEDYFSGTRTTFSVPLLFEGTDFQQRIWQMVYEIPFGKTATYLDLALKAGDKNLIRAVGGANGANKLPIIVPCHRVIGTNGKLTGYAGGLWRKERLLKFEGQKAQPELFEFALTVESADAK